MKTLYASELKELEGKTFTTVEDLEKAEAQVKTENEAKAKAELEAKKAAEIKKKEQDNDLQELVDHYNKFEEAEKAYLKVYGNVLKKYGSVRLFKNGKEVKAEVVKERPIRFYLDDLFSTPTFDEILSNFLK